MTKISFGAHPYLLGFEQLERLVEGELASAPRVRQGRRRSLLGARLPEALARLMSPLL